MAYELLDASNKRGGVRVRITERPREHDIEGVDLELLRPGTVCDVSATVGSWLIVQGYAYPEMRRDPNQISEEDEFVDPPPEVDRRRK